MKQTVIKILSDLTGTPIQDITEDSSPETLKAWDSLCHLRLVLTIEEKFGITFTDDQIVSMSNVQEIIDTIQKNQ